MELTFATDLKRHFNHKLDDLDLFFVTAA